MQHGAGGAGGTEEHQGDGDDLPGVPHVQLGDELGHRQATADQGQGGTDPGQERPLVGQREPVVGGLADLAHPVGVEPSRQHVISIPAGLRPPR